MDQLVSRLLLYGDLGEDSILRRLAELFQEWQGHSTPRQTLVRGLYHQVKRLLDLATDYGFDGNLWQNYLTFLLMTNENSFSLITERVGQLEGTVNHFAKSDFGVFRALFHYDFGPIEADLGIDCFTTLCHYTAIYKHERRYNKAVSEKVRALSHALAAAQDDETFFHLVTDHYRRYGVGMIGLNKAFRVKSGPEGVSLLPIYNTDKVMLADLVGYESQKQQLRENTEAFLAGRTANNALLYGDAGTGKSSSVKALINEYYDQGLRMIEIYKHQFQDLSAVIALVKNRNYRFIVFIDDLSFEENEVEYKFLKAVIEGGVETTSSSTPPPTAATSSGRPGRTGRTWSTRTTSTTPTPWRRSSPSPPGSGCGSTTPSPTGPSSRRSSSPWPSGRGWPCPRRPSSRRPPGGRCATAASPAARPSSSSTTWQAPRRRGRRRD